MHNPESDLENETQHSLGFWDADFFRPDDQTTRPSDSQQQKQLKDIYIERERSCRIVDVSADHRVKLKESKRKEKYEDLARELKKLRSMKVTVILFVNSTLGTVTKGLAKGLEDENKKTSGRHQKYSSVEIGKNTEKSPGDLMRLAVIQPPLVNNQLTLVWKTLKRVYAKNLHLTIPTNGICTTRHLS